MNAAPGCAACAGPMRPDVLPGTFRCAACGFLCSDLPVRINAAEAIDEDVRAEALKPIRDANFAQLLEACADLLPPGTRLLDVGCAHGWFLQAAAARGIAAEGLEPDRDMLRRAHAAGLAAREGFFPQALPQGAQYQAITFNDVFEHLPQPAAMARAVAAALAPGGIAIVNLPVAEGFIFRAARVLGRLGLRGPLARMWQEGLPSPHLSYFTAPALERMFADAGLALVRRGELASIVTTGLYARIRYDRSVGPARAAVLYGAALAARAVAGLFPSDIQYFVFRRPE
jgi:SAM-dependent methyltransferase